MKIVLVHLSSREFKDLDGDYSRKLEPLALEYIAAGLYKDNDVFILDERIETDLIKRIEEIEPHIVGISSLTCNINKAVKLCQATKKINPNIYTVIGGSHVSMVPASVTDISVDFMILGEGIYTFQKMVEKLSLNQKDFSEIVGLMYRDKNNQFIHPESQRIYDIAKFPLPLRTYKTNDYSMIMRINKELKRYPVTSMILSSGCPYKCNFCSVWHLKNGKYYKRTPQSIVEELKLIPNEIIYIADDESMIDKSYVVDVFTAIEKAGINKKFIMYGRCDTIIRNPDLIPFLKERGVIRINIGIESPTNNGLESLNKEISTSDHEKALEILFKHNMNIFAFFIVDPNYSEKDFTRLKDYVFHLGLDSLAVFSILTPLPGTSLAESLRDSVTSRNYDLYDCAHAVLPTKVPLEEFYILFRTLYGDVYKIPKEIRPKLPVAKYYEGLYLDHATADKTQDLQPTNFIL